MHQKKRISSENKANIIRMADEGIKGAEIARQLDLTPAAVYKTIQRHHFNSTLPPKEKTSKSSMSGAMVRTLKRIIEERPFLFGIALKKAFDDAKPADSPEVSLKTLKRHLVKLGFKRMKMRNKAIISQKNAAKRLYFAKKHQSSESQLWRSVVWSDETTVRECPVGKDRYFFVHSARQNQKMNVNPQKQQGGFSVMFWGCFSWYGFGPLVALEKSMDSDEYIRILDHHVSPHLSLVHEKHQSDILFQQDNAPCHKSKKVTDHLSRGNINILDWPAQSPDLNPIENLWAIVKRRLQEDPGDLPKNKTQLIQRVQGIWSSLNIELARKLVDSMPNRISECIKNDGYHTKY